MSVPFMAIITQTLPVYTHEYALIWYTNPCVISTVVESGGTKLRKDASDSTVIEAYSANLADEDVEVSVTIKAYYSTYLDPSPPSQ